MEKKIIKTIREAFKVAYISKLLKESPEEFSKKLTKEELVYAESIYPSFVAGTSGITWGNLNKNVQNYLIEKAVDEYRQSDSKKIQNSIATFYYPTEGSEIYKYIKQKSKYSTENNKNLVSRFGENSEFYFSDILLNAWTQYILDDNYFKRTIEYFKDNKEREDGIGSFILSSLEIWFHNLIKSSNAKKRGGNTQHDSLNALDFDETGDQKFGTSKIELQSDDEIYNKMEKMISQFGNEAANYFSNKGKDLLATLATEFFINKKSYNDILKDNPKFTGKNAGNISTMVLLQVLGPKPVKEIARRIGSENGFPKNWLENIITNKNINGIADLFKIKDTAYVEPKKSDKLVFEKFIQNNMDKIMEEIYKRISK